jgi:hypothetical protein
MFVGHNNKRSVHSIKNTEAIKDEDQDLDKAQADRVV